MEVLNRVGDINKKELAFLKTIEEQSQTLLEKNQRIDKVSSIAKKRKIAIEEECANHAVTTKQLGLQAA